jgi:diguanylate cyclase (GGDEF)-like protein
VLRIEGTFLRSAVGRRIFVLFLLASALPLALVGAFSYRGLSDHLAREANAELVRDSKNSAMAALERVHAARDALCTMDLDGGQDATRRKPCDRDPDGPHVAPPTVTFRSVAVRVTGATEARLIAGGDVPPSMFDSVATLAKGLIVGTGDTAIVAVSNGDFAETTIALVYARKDPTGTVFMGLLKPDQVFGTEDLLPANTELCVFSSTGLALSCSDRSLAAAARRAISSASATNLRGPDGQDRDVGAWTLSLGSELRSTPWTFVSIRPVAGGAFATRQIGRTYLALGFSCLLFVAVLSLSQIRRILVPLERLVDGARRLGAGDFTQPIAVVGRDEFGRLTEAFNDMARRLGQQLQVLRTMSSMDREILAGKDLAQIIETVLRHLEQTAPESRAAVAVVDTGIVSSAPLPYWRLVEDSLWGSCMAGISAEQFASLPEAGETSPSTEASAGEARALVGALFDPTPERVRWVTIRTRSGLRILLALASDAAFSADTPALDSMHEFASRVGVANDAADRERRLVHEAQHDSLTELPNRRHLHELIDQRVAAETGAANPFAVLFVDLDRFKGVNDALGHDAGDQLLLLAAERIRGCIRGDDVLGRLGGDEFIVVASIEGDRAAATQLADRIVAAFSASFCIRGLDIHVGASVGAALFPEHGTNREDLLRNADIAMYNAKKAGRGRSVTFQESMGKKAVELFELEKDLRAALVRDEIFVAYQPRIELATGVFSGAEALARWNHPQRGNVSPAVFIALAEETGLIDAVGERILSKACQQLAAWQRAGLRMQCVSVNLSVRQLYSRNLIHVLRETVADAGLHPSHLEIEITESAVLEDIQAGRMVLERLRDAGFSIALDDFGTGYSSLSYLRTLPIQMLKLDRSFLKDVESDRRSQVLVQSIITMAHGLGIRVIAEGVESPGQARMLQAWGCDEGQGYLFARPMSVSQFEEFTAHQAESTQGNEVASWEAA